MKRIVVLWQTAIGRLENTVWRRERVKSCSDDTARRTRLDVALIPALATVLALCAAGGYWSTVASAQPAMAAVDPPAESSAQYTAYNLWFKNPKKISCINYRVGTILPAGSEVSEFSTHLNTIQFRLADGGREFSIQFHPKFHPGVSIQEFTKRLFVSQPLEKRTKTFSDQEKEMISRGAVESGMSKEAVLVSWGYPPEHHTLSTKANSWLYWRNRFRKNAVEFDNNGKVFNVR